MESFTTFLATLVCCLALGVVVESQEDPLARCHTLILTPHHFLNQNRFLGSWYPLKIGYSKTNQVYRPLNFTCLEVNLRQNPQDRNVLDVTESLNVVENGVVTGPESYEGVSVIGEANPAEPIPAIWVNHGLDSDGNRTETTQSVVVASDEDSWAVVYNCGVRDGALLERISIWSRRRYLDPLVEDVLDTLAYGIGFQYSNFLSIEQSQC